MKSDMLEFVERVQAWHGKKLAHLRDVVDSVDEGVKLQLQGEGKASEIVLTKREAAIFALGMNAAIDEFAQLPFTVQRGDGADDEQG